MNIFITGASGYIGGMLVDRFAKDSKVTHITALDMKPLPNLAIRLPSGNRIAFVQHNLGDSGWEEKVLEHGMPDVVIHAAYVIRQAYGKKREWQIKSNITAAERVFDFVFKNKIPRLIHFSTVASYGALPQNSVSYKFRESDLLRETNYLYGADKKIIEEKLKKMFHASPASSNEAGRAGSMTQVLVVRPCAVTGPLGQNQFRRFGLLQMIKYGLPVVPITGHESARQFVHEDDVWEAVKLMAGSPRFASEAGGRILGRYEIFNLAPPEFLLLKDMAKEIGKVSVMVPPAVVKVLFALMWHLSQGRLPTVPAGVNSYTYPIVVDGSKIAKCGFQYRYTARDALKADKGYYSQRPS